MVQTPDCIVYFEWDGNGSGSRNTPTFDNRFLGCQTWSLVYQSVATSGAFTGIKLQSAPLAAEDNPGVWVDFTGVVTSGTNPNTNQIGASSQFVNGLTSIPFIRVLWVEGSFVGHLSGVLYGWRTQGSLGSGGGSGSEIDESAFVAGSTLGVPIMGADLSGNRVLIAAINPVNRKLLVEAAVTVTPSTSTRATAPLVNVIDTVAETVLAGNVNRVRFMLQNAGTSRIYIAFGAAPTTVNYDLALPGGGNQNDGSSPPYIDEVWIGDVQAISNVNGGLLQVTEFTT